MAAKKAASGAGSTRKKTKTVNGKVYTWREARVTTGTDPGTGKPVRRTFTASTQKEVRQKMQAAAVEVDQGSYREPSKMTLGQWLDIWCAEYLGDVKPSARSSYCGIVKNHLKPGLGAVKLQGLQPHQVQEFINNIKLAPKTVQNIHGVLHAALGRAVHNHYIRANPAECSALPRIKKAEIMPLDDDGIAAFLAAIKGHRFEAVYTLDIFTGLRRGELLGLTWGAVDFKRGTILIDKQLQIIRGTKGQHELITAKHDRVRTITPAPSMMQLLRRVDRQQLEWRLRAGELWQNEQGFVFTDELGQHLKEQTVYHNFKAIAAKIGLPKTRLHDLRHTYATAARRGGDDVKAVQEALGHYSAAFTLDTYAHVTAQMRQESAQRMDDYVKKVAGK